MAKPRGSSAKENDFPYKSVIQAYLDSTSKPTPKLYWTVLIRLI